MKGLHRRLLTALLLLCAFPSCSPRQDPSPGAAAADSPKPRLLVLLALDQFRADYLQRFDGALTGGLRRLIDEGYWYRRARVAHAPTLTIPGMTTLGTGVHPKTHGFVGNAVWNLETGQRVGERVIFLDPSETTVGDPEAPGISPRLMLADGLADWVRAAHPDAISTVLSTEPVAVLLAGRTTGSAERSHAYWPSERTRAFVTSTFYRADLPEWIVRFNDQELPRFLANELWELTVPEEQRDLAGEDAAPWEFDGIHTTFPHLAEQEAGRREGSAPDATAIARWLFDTPLGDEALFSLAETAVRAQALGQREATDFLALVHDSTDQVGHQFGSSSLELLDTVVRYDALLGRFLKMLDAVVGSGNYVVALSADHGGPNISEYEIDRGRPGRRVSEPEIAAVLGRVERLVSGFAGSEEELTDRVAAELQAVDFVSRAMTPAQLLGGSTDDDTLAAYHNSYRPDRVTNYPLWDSRYLGEGLVTDGHPALLGIMVELVEQANIFTAPSTHGSAYPYDREVPIVLFGAGVARGRSDASARTVDVAPTLAALGAIPVPPGLDGRPLDVVDP